MLQGPGARAHTLLIGTFVGVISAAAAVAQQGSSPVAAMFSADQKRDASRAASFEQVDLPATTAAAVPLRVYLSAGDLERAFDRPEFRPDAEIVPTNTDLLITAPQPATQRVLISRVQKHREVMRDLMKEFQKLRRITGKCLPLVNSEEHRRMVRDLADHIDKKMEACRSMGA